MKAQLIFNLPEEQPEFMQAIHGSDAVHVLNEISQRMRSIYKYESHTAEVYEVVEKLREELFQLCAEYKIDLL
jgi:hypothetical protein